MKAPPMPANESERLQALCDLDILDTAPEERFDRLTRVARALFDVPIAIISLVDAERQWFKSRQGLDATETPRDISFCGHAILEGTVFHIPDALNDDRFADNPLVTGPLGIRFYAGAPLSAKNGSRIGTLCVLDTEPRIMSQVQQERLRDLANCVADELNQVKLTETLAELEDQRRYTSQILESVSEGIIVIDETGTVRSFNPAAERMFGFDAAEIIGGKFTCLLTPNDATRLSEQLRQFLTEGDPGETDIRQEVEGQRSDGTTFSVGLAIGTTEFKGERMFNGVVRDITTRKEIDRMKDEFIATVSHELRTPLTSIMGSIGLIKGGTFGPPGDEIQNMLEIAYSSSERLVRLINEMLDLERIQSGVANLEFSPVDLGEIAQTSLQELSGFLRRHDVTAELSVPDEPVRTLGDTDKLAQSITNIVSNAIKHSPAGETVSVTVADRHGHWRITVRDKGRGIPLSFQPDVFKRFSQADTTDSRATQGTGLGLSIAKAIIDLHGGSISFESEEGRGTSFYIDLPALQDTGDTK
ncbi:GAF domain-containing sensor histidine kinase [Elongatibacter sediminis]|uniref:histidine kinase n=1 Tax=Elongatibacter sediminis TaxID=3119006 RepID=A0AAW9RCA9_9GAMM